MPEPVIIVGSGAAAAGAALSLSRLGVRPVMLDVGHTPRSAPKIKGNLYDLRKERDCFDLFIGEDLSGLSGVLNEAVGIAKLNAPSVEFVTRGAAHLSPVEAVDFDPIQSFARGGLGNAWGAGLYRFTEADLTGFPLTIADLDPYFDILTDEIGISGADDDLRADFGDPRGLLPALRLSHNAGKLYARYQKRRDALCARGIRIGRPRLGVLSVEKDGRAACDYSNTEFWQDAPYLYRPTVTIERLIASGQLDYRSGLLVQSFAETPEGVRVKARDLSSDRMVEISGKALILAAGAINTTKIVLASHEDHQTALPLFENPAVQIPFVIPTSIGRSLDTRAFGLTQLNLVWDAIPFGCRVQGSFLELTSPMRAEFFGRFPLSARANLGLVRDLLPAMILMQLFFPGSAQPPARLSLRPDGALRIEGHPNTIDTGKLGGLLAALRQLGLWTSPRLIHKAVTGHAIHYACTLPMRRAPGRYECHPSGRLAGTRGVYIGDSAGFSGLPAKNMSFGMMANAMRVATGAAREA